MEKTKLRLLSAIAQAIYDKKGFNILALDVRGISSLTDYIIIAEGNIDRHVKALSGAVKDALHEMHERPLFVEGERMGDWVVIDSGDVIIHLMIPDFREKYSLEGLWRQASIVDVSIDTSRSKVSKIDQEDYTIL